jgi:hypothetical protein
MTQLYTPLQFWFNKNAGLSFTHPASEFRSKCEIKSIDKDELYFRICDCSDTSIKDILLNKNDELQKNKLNPYKCGLLNLINVIDSRNMYIRKYDLCNEYVLEDIKLCVYFFQIKKHLENNFISLWDFICGYLSSKNNRSYTQDGGFDYLLMNILESYNVIDHGSGIRCGWLADDKKFDVNSEPLLKEEIINWIKSQ